MISNDVDGSRNEVYSTSETNVITHFIPVNFSAHL